MVPNRAGAQRWQLGIPGQLPRTRAIAHAAAAKVRAKQPRSDMTLVQYHPDLPRYPQAAALPASRAAAASRQPGSALVLQRDGPPCSHLDRYVAARRALPRKVDLELTR